MLVGFALAGLVAAPAAAQTIEETVTDNGLRIWSFPDDGGERFLIRVLVGSGSREEERARTGIAHLLEHVLLGSTREWSRAASSEVLDRIGASFNGTTTHDSTAFYVSTSPESWREAVGWLAAHLVDPAFAEHDLEAERRIVYEEIRSREPHAGAVTSETLLYPGHALGRSVGGDADQVRSASAEDLRRFYERHYRTENMAIGFAGRVPHEAVRDEIARAFEGLLAGPAQKSRETLRPWTGSKVIATEGTQGFVELGYHLPAGSVAELGLQRMLTLYLADRVFEVIREERQLSYAPEFSLRRYADAARLWLSVEVSNKSRLAEVVEVADQLVDELGEPNSTLFRSAQSRAAGVFEVNDPGELGDAMEVCWLAARAGDAPRELVRRIQRATPEDLSRYAAAHLREEQRFLFSNASLHRGLWSMLVTGLLVTFLIVDGLRGFAWLRSTADSLRRRFRRPLRPVRRASGGGDDLEMSFQRYFEERDRER